MSTVLNEVIALAAKHSGLPVERLNAGSALYQDLGLIGDDMDLFIAALVDLYGVSIRDWPWQRFTNLNEPTILTALATLVKVPLRMIRGQRNHGARFERLELGHIAAVIESGQWRNP